MSAAPLQLGGLIPAVVTPFAAAGDAAPGDPATVDAEVLGAHIDGLVGSGVGAVAVNMDTGEGPALTQRERDLTVAVACDAAAGRVSVEPLVLGAAGSLIGLGSVLARQQVRLHDLVDEAEFSAAATLARDTVQPLADLLFADPVGRYRARVKYALAYLGIIPCPDVRAPLQPLSPEEGAAVSAGIEALR